MPGVDTSPAPSVRLLMGRFAEGPGYHTRRDDGIAEWLLVWTEGGLGRFGSRGRPDVVAVPGSLTAVTPGTPHEYSLGAEAEEWALWWAHVRPRPDWLPLLDWPEPAPGIRQIRFVPEVRRHVQSALDAALRAYRAGTPLAGLAALNRLEAALLWCDSDNAMTALVDERVVAVLDHIHADLKADLSLPALARVATLSVSRLAHLFREQVGTSPQRFVEAQRMAVAQQLLEFTQRSVASVGREVGFEDPLHFSARFRLHTGQSPRAYRSRTPQADAVTRPTRER